MPTVDREASRRALGVHRVLEPHGVLPQAAWRLDTSTDIGPDEVLVRVQRLNLDAASIRQLREAHHDDGRAVRAAVLALIAERGKMHNPVTGSGGMLVGVVEKVGADSPLGLTVGDAVATLVSLTLTPLVIHDGLRHWSGLTEQVPCDGHAVLFARSVAARLPNDLDRRLALGVLDVCGAPALVQRVLRTRDATASIAVLGGAGKSGSLALAAAAGTRRIAVVRDAAEAAAVTEAGLADAVVIADARDPVALQSAMHDVGGPADVTVVCVDVPGTEHAAILATADAGTVIFFSMATSFTQAALGAEGVAADVTMLIGNGYVPGHAELAVDLVRADAGLRRLLHRRLHLPQ